MARFVINEFHTATIFQWQSCSFRHYVTGTVCQRLRGRGRGNDVKRCARSRIIAPHYSLYITRCGDKGTRVKCFITGRVRATYAGIECPGH